MKELGIIINGFRGTMGGKVYEEVQKANDVIVVGAIDKNKEGITVRSVLDEEPGKYVIIDFSLPSATSELLSYAIGKGYPIVIATTGHSEEEKKEIQLAAQRIPIIMASNFSIGANLFMEAIALIVKAYKKLGVDVEIEITEWHHIRKKDAPSGTAKTIKERILSELGTRKEIEIKSVREGDIIGIHKVQITVGNEVIGFLHKVQDRALFAEGALNAAKFIAEMPLGFYTMDDLIKQLVV